MTDNLDALFETVADINDAERTHAGPATDPVTWLDNHGDALYTYALARVREPATAEDLVQDTLLAALSSRDSFNGESSERTWITGILKHKIIDHLRKRHREQPLGDNMEDDKQAIDAWFDDTGHWIHKPGHWESPEQSMETQQFWELLQDCVDRLPEKLRLVYILREFDEMETDDIIATLGISSKNNLWVMLSRARLQLRGSLESSWFTK